MKIIGSCEMIIEVRIFESVPSEKIPAVKKCRTLFRTKMDLRLLLDDHDRCCRSCGLLYRYDLFDCRPNLVFCRPNLTERRHNLFNCRSNLIDCRSNLIDCRSNLFDCRTNCFIYRSILFDSLI